MRDIINEDTSTKLKPKLVEDLGIFIKEGTKTARRYGIFECPYCLKHFTTMTTSAVCGNTKSCGCQTLNLMREASVKHNLSRSRLYNCWRSMLKRVNLPTTRGYKNYGGRGIEITPSWYDFNTFSSWAFSVGYTEETHKNLSLDRIDVNGNYEPSNCRWADTTIQNRNRRKKENTTSKYIGVYLKGNRWIARVVLNSKSIYLGGFLTEDEAGEAYNEYIRSNKLEGFNLNIIDKGD